MSYAFDVIDRAWADLRKSLPEEQRNGELATRFGFMLGELHDANHRLGDAVNHDARVTAKARRLDAAIAKATGSAA